MNTDKAFNADVGVATTEIYRLQADFDHFPEEVKGIITNMFFNLGYDRCVLFYFGGFESGVMHQIKPSFRKVQVFL